ncbi:MAG TPA: hypothetical protein VK425_08230 [Acidimicrobiales bacterium]|nr:hypothetical protein [Acidimicrobiales bacterium]
MASDSGRTGQAGLPDGEAASGRGSAEVSSASSDAEVCQPGVPPVGMAIGGIDGGGLAGTPENAPSAGQRPEEEPPVPPHSDAGALNLETGAWDLGTDGYSDAYADEGGYTGWRQEAQWRDHQTEPGWHEEGDWQAGAQWQGEAAWAPGYPGAEGGETWYEEEGAGWAEGTARAAQGSGDGQERWYGAGYYRPPPAGSYGRSRQEAVSAYRSGYTASVMPRTWEEGAPPTGRRRRKPGRASGPWPELVMITAVAVIIAAVILAVTSANNTNRNGAQGSPTSPAVTSSGARTKSSGSAPGSTATSVPTSTSATTTAKPTTTKPATPNAKNLFVNDAVKQSIIRSWLATNPGGVGLVAKDVAGTVPGTVYYGEQPGPKRVYWAIAAFQPSATLITEKSTPAGQAALAQFQDSDYVFSWKSGPYWTELGYVSNGECPGSYVPRAMLSVWGLCGL